MLTYYPMESKITHTTETEVHFTVHLDASHLSPIKAEVLDHLRGRVKAAGFRPGKAPDMIVERELGSSTVHNDVIDHAIQHTYSQAIKELGIQVVASPKVSLEKFVPYTELEYKVVAELMPKVKLADYTKMRVKRPPVKVERAEVDGAIDEMRQKDATRLSSEQPAKKGDEVNFDFEGTKDGEPVSGASAKKQTLKLGSGQFIPGFEEEMISLQTGDEKTFDIKFPDGYHEASLAGQVVTFKIKINGVTDLVLPEIDNEFLTKMGPFKSEAELRTSIEDRLKAEKAESASRAYEQEVLDKLLKDSNFKTPEALVKQQTDRMRKELEQNLASSGLDVAKYLDLTGKTAADMDKEMRPEAERRVGLAMVLTEVAAAEKLSISEPELDAEIGRLKLAYPDTQTQTELDNPATREEVYNHLMASKVISKLLSYADSK